MAISEPQINFFSQLPQKKVLIVMALKEESGEQIEAAGYSVFYTGMGSYQTLSNLSEFYFTSLLQNQKFPFDHILNLGTAGSFQIPVGSLVQVKTSSRRGECLPLLNTYSKLNLIDNLSQELYSNVHCLSGDFISTNNTDSPQVKQIFIEQNVSKPEIFDMELSSICFFAEKYKIPVTSFKYITDASDHKTYQDWKSQLKNAQKSFLQLLENLK